MKNILAITLLLSLTAPLVTSYWWLQNRRAQVKKAVKQEMVAGMEHTDLVALTFAVADTARLLEWEHEREFIYQEEYYDVVDREIRGDSVIYFCWWDNEETLLSQQLDQLLAHALGNDPLQQTKKQHLEEFGKTLYCSDLSFPIGTQTHFVISCWPPYREMHTSLLAPPPTPPPC